MVYCTRALTVFVLMLSLDLSRSSGQTRLAVPSYQNPGTSTWQSWAAQGPAAAGIMIVDINKGDDQSYNSRVDSAIQQTRKKGIYVLGYTYTSYGARDPKVIRQKIDAVYNNYNVDGIFLTKVRRVAALPTSTRARIISTIRNWRITFA